jgi:hypothetical protein
MGPSVDQIEAHIETRREDLRSNLEELGQKAKSAVDWRERFRANPGAILAVAFGGGFLIARMLGGSRAAPPPDSPVSQRAATLTGAAEPRKRLVSRAWDDIQSALVGVVAEKVTRTLGEVVPGFKEQLAGSDRDARIGNGRSGPH